MLPPESKLEVRSRLPARRNGKPPLLFVHGGYCDAWCWEPYFLPYFAEQGYAAHALSLRGHGASGGRESLFVAGLDDYAADVEHVAGTLPSPPVLIGHSMGAAIVERLLVTRPVRAAALIAPIPPGGLAPVMSRLAAQQPEYLVRMQQLDPSRFTTDVLTALLPFHFSAAVSPEILAQAVAHTTNESPRVLLDLTLRLHGGRPIAHARPFVLGAGDDQISTPSDVNATAQLYEVNATIVPGLAHMLMLEPRWETAARPLFEWLEHDIAHQPARE
jgi:pimeloyl-ACP methyl ester carboxylesterase